MFEKKRVKVASFAILVLCVCAAGRAMSQEATVPAAPQPEKAPAPEGAQPQPQAEAPKTPQTPQAPQAPQAAQPQPAQPQAPAPTEQGAAKIPTIVLDSQEVQGILGKEALSRTGEKMGQIVDVIVDRSGRIRAAIIDFGGFLGVGSRKIAVDWQAVHFVPGGKTIRIILDLTRDEVVGSHEYKPNDQITILEPPAEAATENAEAKPAPPAPEQ